jgi:hypothetical protein
MHAIWARRGWSENAGQPTFYTPLIVRVPGAEAGREPRLVGDDAAMEPDRAQHEDDKRHVRAERHRTAEGR